MPVSHSFRHQHSARPQPHPAECPPGRCRNAQLRRTHIPRRRPAPHPEILSRRCKKVVGRAGSVGAAEGSLLPQSIFSRRRLTGAFVAGEAGDQLPRDGGQCLKPRREQGLLWAWPGCTSFWEPQASLTRRPRPCWARRGEYVNTGVPPAPGLRGWDLGSIPGFIPNPSTRGPEPRN